MEFTGNVPRKQITFRDEITDIPSTTYGTFGLYGYPAKFIPQVIAYVLDEYADPGMTVFDPFAGYGTTGVVSGDYGHDYELWDLNPLLETLHKVATMKQPKQDVDNLLAEMKRCNHEFIPDWSNFSYWFPEEFLPFLSKVWGFYHSLTDEEAKSLLTIPLLKITRIFSYDDIQRQKLSKSPKSKKRVSRLLEDNWQNIFYRKVEEEVRAIIKGVAEHHALSPKPDGKKNKEGLIKKQMNMKLKWVLIYTPPRTSKAKE